MQRSTLHQERRCADATVISTSRETLDRIFSLARVKRLQACCRPSDTMGAGCRRRLGCSGSTVVLSMQRYLYRYHHCRLPSPAREKSKHNAIYPITNHQSPISIESPITINQCTEGQCVSSHPHGDAEAANTHHPCRKDSRAPQAGCLLPRACRTGRLAESRERCTGSWSLQAEAGPKSKYISFDLSGWASLGSGERVPTTGVNDACRGAGGQGNND